MPSHFSRFSSPSGNPVNELTSREEGCIAHTGWYLSYQWEIFFLIFGGHQSFLWAHWYLSFELLETSALGFKARVDPSFACSPPMCNGFLRFTSSATSADLLMASIAVKPFWSTYFYMNNYWWDTTQDRVCGSVRNLTSMTITFANRLGLFAL